MFNKAKLSIIYIAIGCLFFLSGCNVTAKPKTKANEKAGANKLTTQLSKLESNSEDIIDDISKPDWDKAATRLKNIQTNMEGIKKSYKATKIPDKLISNLETDFSKQNKK